jgi:hypothetical protein
MIRTLTLSLFGLLLSVTAFADGGARDYEVTITNITQAQIFAPVAVATHNSHFSLFTPGAAALPELATLAESGNPGPLLELLDGMPGYVLDTNHSGGVLHPGDSVTVMISGSNHYDRLSLVSMLVSSNDAFAGLSSMALPKRWSATMVSAFDAGSELNDEDCANIPGPPCGDMDDSGEAGEGYVYIGNGISGNGDLDSMVYDWNNAVARVVVRRVR